MLTGTQRIFDDPAQAAASAAEALLGLLEKHDVARRGLCNIALSGGSTPNAIYDYLAGLADGGGGRGVRALALKARFFWSDERTVARDSADSNFGSAWTRWLGGLDLPTEQVCRLPGEQTPLIAAAQYQRLIEAFVPGGGGGLAGVPRFDLIFLGMGPDGHTASLFPGTAAVQEDHALVVSNVVPQQHTTRLTFTFPLINAAAQVWILCTGASKAAALSEVAKAGVKGDLDYPISRVQPADKKALTWWLDRAAVGELKT